MFVSFASAYMVLTSNLHLLATQSFKSLVLFGHSSRWVGSLKPACFQTVLIAAGLKVSGWPSTISYDLRW